MDKSKEFFDGFDNQGNETNEAGKNAFEKMGMVSDNNADSGVRSELGAPADFSTGFDVDITNPFYEAPANDREVVAIATIAGDHDEAVAAAKETPAQKSQQPTISKDDLLKQAKKKKKIAKAIFNTRRK